MFKTIFASASVTLALLGSAAAQDVREFSFGYDQPKPTGYGFAGDLFESKIDELSGGSMKINQFPGGQLGQEPVMLQKMRSGDIDFIITASANGATLSPQLGVMSLHYLFTDEDQLAKAIASPELNDAVKALVEKTVEGAHALTLMTYAGRTIGLKLRYDDFKTVTRDCTLDAPTQDAGAIRRAAGSCLKRVPLDQRIRLLGVRVGALSQPGALTTDAESARMPLPFE
jgi:TRAP-type C4-dicarboxylate transport system substrate-binding protein